MGGHGDSRVYVGNLPPDVREKEVEDLFYKYGRIRGVTLKNRRGPPFAFVEFEDARDADDAVSGRNGYNFDGYRVRVEHPKQSNFFARSDHNSFRGRGGGDRGGGDRGGGPSQRTKYRVLVTGLPPTGSWQDLKDHMREAGDVSYSDVYKDGSGIVDFVNKDDMKFAVRHLDDTKFKSHEGETSYIRVKLDRESRSTSRGRSRSPRRSPSYSPRNRSRSRSRSRDHSPDRRSRSRSPY